MAALAMTGSYDTTEDGLPQGLRLAGGTDFEDVTSVGSGGAANDTTNRSRPYTTPHQTATELGFTHRPRWARTLSRPSDPHPILVWLMNEALSAILLCSDGAVMPTEAPIRGSSSSGHRVLVGGSDIARIVDRLDGSFCGCRTDLSRLRVVRDAQQTLMSLKYAPKLDPKVVKGTREWREEVARTPGSLRKVASQFRVSHEVVRKYRREFHA